MLIRGKLLQIMESTEYNILTINLHAKESTNGILPKCSHPLEVLEEAL